jgi:hypothetical protein
MSAPIKDLVDSIILLVALSLTYAVTVFAFIVNLICRRNKIATSKSDFLMYFFCSIGACALGASGISLKAILPLWEKILVYSSAYVGLGGILVFGLILIYLCVLDFPNWLRKKLLAPTAKR